MIEILKLGNQYSPELLTKALTIAHENKTFNSRAVKGILEQLAAPKNIDHAKLKHLPQPRVKKREARDFN